MQPRVNGRFASAPILERIEKRTVINGDCVEWTGYTCEYGYGKIGYKGRTLRVHKLYYELVVGEIAPGLELDHLCGNKPCIKIEHLKAVTHKENMQTKRLVFSGRYKGIRDKWPDKRKETHRKYHREYMRK